ncbi:MAG: transcriptional regulator, partial [Oricola sp.]
MALPDAVISTLAGIYDVMNGVSMMGIAGPGAVHPFKVEIVGERAGPLRLASGVPIDIQCSIEDISECDILIVPSVLLKPGGWQTGRYPRLVDWILRMHDGGARLCSAC